MCSLAVILRATPRHACIIAANRDESRRRPTRAPFLWDTRPRILAGRDEIAGGTWMGLNEHGVFAGLTNLHGHGSHDPSRGSRGALMKAVLSARDLHHAAEILAGLDPAATNPFLLVCADRDGGGFWTSSAGGLRPAWLGPGVHAFGNRLPDDPLHRKGAGALRHIAAAWESRTGDSPAGIVSALAVPLREHIEGGAPEASLCVHTTGDYGTVSSTIVVTTPRGDAGGDRSAAEDASLLRFLHAPGPPCTTGYEDLGPLLRELWRPDGAVTA